MPRKASQAAKKESAAAEPKSEGGTTRRSGRSVTKQEPASGKEASRSRRSSTAAQTAASVADSKSPKGRSSTSRRDSTSPSDGRQKGRRGSMEASTRAKSSRRGSSRVNYKESDGEEEAAPKFEETFESNEEFDDSESDEKSKPKGRSKPVKTPAKGRASKGKSKGARSRRGRPKKQSSDEEEEEEETVPIELSEDSVEVDEESTNKKAKETATKESTRSGRGRKAKTEDSEVIPIEEKPKSRRSARAAPVKETPKRRPSRGVQAKRYTEDDEEIEEIDDSKVEEDAVKPQGESGRKRKRGSTTESNKRLKEEESAESQEKETEADAGDDVPEKEGETKSVDSDNEKEQKEDDPVEEPMEVDASDAADVENKEPASIKGEEKTEEKMESAEDEKKESKKEEASENSALSSSKDKSKFPNKQESIDSSENLDESMHSFDSDQGSRAEQSVSSGLEDSQDVKETKPTTKTVAHQEDSVDENIKSQVEYQPDSSNSFQELDDSSESKGLNETGLNNEKKAEPNVDKPETNLEKKVDNATEGLQGDTKVPQENKTEVEKPSVTPPAPVAHSKESNLETLNRSEESVSNSAHVIHSTPQVNTHPEDTAPKANGAHDLHNNSVSENDQYYPFPGRKYIVNAKLGDTIRQSVKDKSFGFVSYNLGLSSSPPQKEKLLNELNKLDAHIICIQQVSEHFYSNHLEPSLDALGFKGTFSQPEESEPGVATFYKNSLFRLSGQSAASLKHLIEKELEASSLDGNDRMAVKTYVKNCGHALFTHFATVVGMHSLTVANVQVPPTDVSIHALQVSCLVREVVKINGGTSKPFLLGGEFNMIESEAPYQLLRDGYLSNDMIEELQRRVDVSLPGKENAALLNLLWKSFQHPSSTLCSCYKSVLDREVFIPEQKVTSPDLLWYSSDSLYTTGVLDTYEISPPDRHLYLKADIAFSV